MTKQITLPIILDGGMGRELEKMGAPFQQPEWSAQALLEAPHFVSQAHQRFIEAGAEVITTNTYAVVPFHIGEKRFNTQGADLIKRAARLAKQCASNSPNLLVAGCIPPVLGSYRADLFSVPQARPLVEMMIENQQDDVDLWLAETISCIDEASMIKQCTASTDKPTWIAFSIKDEISSSATLRSGESVYDAVTQIAGQHVSAILFNCSCVEVMEGALVDAKQALLASGLDTQVQLGVFANNFPPIGNQHQANDSVSIIRDDVPPTQYAAFASTWLAAGASIIGGCCGISPAHIKQLAVLKGHLAK